MLYKGSFLNQKSEEVEVLILTGGDRSATTSLNGDAITFTDNPVEITSEANDTFDHLLTTSATIRLQCRALLSDLFTRDCADAVVNIYRAGVCVFAGFIEPQAYSQDFNEVYDEISISCIDLLSALRYSQYRHIGESGVDYDEVRNGATVLSFAEVLTAATSHLMKILDIKNGATPAILFDGSKTGAFTTATRGRLEEFGISELLMLGNDEEDVWTCQSVVEEMMRFLNLHIEQQGLTFRVFSWETIAGGASAAWVNLANTAAPSILSKPETQAISLANVAADDTAITIGESYNRITVSCTMQGIDELAESPLESDALTSPFSNSQLYCREFSADADGKIDDNVNAFYHMICDKPYGGVPDNAFQRDWYIRAKDHAGWIFPVGRTDMMAEYGLTGKNQQNIPNALATRICAALVSTGSAVTKVNSTDNSPISKIDMTDSLIIGVNGNCIDDAATTYPTDTDLQTAAPVAVYTGGTSAVSLCQTTGGASRYIVISGKVALNPVMDVSEDYSVIRANGPKMPDNPVWDKNNYRGIFRGGLVDSRTCEDGRLYTRQYFKQTDPNPKEPGGVPRWDESRTCRLWALDGDDNPYPVGTNNGLTPFTADGPQLYEFRYTPRASGAGLSYDLVSKVPAVACMLIIGGYCAVESPTSTGALRDISWQRYKTLSECGNDLDEYYAQSFTIGFNPKIGDHIIGTEFDIQNNIDFSLNIDAEGMAIPLPSDVKLSGKVQMMILGPVNTVWGDVSKRHRTWFRREKWTTSEVPLLAHVSNIVIRDLSISLMSDNGGAEPLTENDLIYVSNTAENFVNVKDGIDFKINSGLTAEECAQLGVADSISLSNVLDMATLAPMLKIYRKRGANNVELGKAEQMYCDSYYSEYREPRVQLTQKIEESGSGVNRLTRFTHPALPGRTFYIVGVSRNLIEGYAELTLKESWL